MGTTLTDIAKEAEVSVSLVSRFFNEDPTLCISDEKRQRIMNAKEKLGGLSINHAARSLAKGKAYNFVVPINRCFSLSWLQSNLTSSDLTRSLEETLSKQSFRLSYVFFDPGHEYETFTDLAGSNGFCDGVVMLSSIADKKIADIIHANKTPHVCIDERGIGLGLNTVTYNLQYEIYTAIEHLNTLGHKKIGYIGNFGTERSHLGYFLEQVRLSGLSNPDNHICIIPQPKRDQSDERWMAAVSKQIDEFVDGAIDISAVVCANDRYAMVTVDILKKRNIKVGKDISVIGIGNIEGSGAYSDEEPFLTTIDREYKAIGTRAGETLLRQVVGKDNEVIQEVVVGKLIVRQSTGPCKTDSCDTTVLTQKSSFLEKF